MSRCPSPRFTAGKGAAGGAGGEPAFLLVESSGAGDVIEAWLLGQPARSRAATLPLGGIQGIYFFRLHHSPSPPPVDAQGARMGWLAVAFGFGLSFGVVRHPCCSRRLLPQRLLASVPSLPCHQPTHTPAHAGMPTPRHTQPAKSPPSCLCPCRSS